ncbi:hypothetical protein BaRGS_00014442, partial [Batillaria attramentaria]
MNGWSVRSTANGHRIGAVPPRQWGFVGPLPKSGNGGTVQTDKVDTSDSAWTVPGHPAIQRLTTPPNPLVLYHPKSFGDATFTLTGGARSADYARLARVTPARAPFVIIRHVGQARKLAPLKV